MKKLKICGLQKTTLLDYPGHIAATLFLGGCNLRCPFCHNAELLDGSAEEPYSQESILSFLSKRRGILEGVCITGGEPTMQPEALEDFIRIVRGLGLLVKLDTNGTRPEVLKDFASKNLLDFVAMDIKAAPEHYPQVCGISGISINAIKESVEWLKTGRLPFEFRTTAVKGLHTRADFERIGPWIEGCTHFYLQNYKASELVLQPEGLEGFSKEELLEFAEIMKLYVKNVAIRGIDY